MAKKKSEAQVETAAEADDFTGRIFDEIGKDFGEGTLIDGPTVLAEKRVSIPICPTLDIITSGGIQEGSWVGITGNPKTTKTTSALAFAANCQRPEYGSRPVYYAKAEGRLSLTYLKGIAGLDMSPGKFFVITSKKGRVLTAQDHFKIYEKVLRTVPRAVLIIDSISALCDERESEGGTGTETRGAGAKLTSQFINIMSNVVQVNDCIVIGITHLMCNTSGWGAKYTEKATRRWHYQCDYQLRTKGKEDWLAGEKQIGFKVKWECETTPTGPPNTTIDTYFRFGTGLDGLFEVVNFGSSLGYVKKSGAWYSLDFLGKPEHKHLLRGREDVPKFHGADKAYAALLENPVWADALKKAVLAAAGLGG